jgi:alpha-mannosidase
MKRSRNSDQDTDRRVFLSALPGIAGLLAFASKSGAAADKRPVFIVPNFHPASCGWLTTFSNERVYCANSYLNHLDRVRDDPEYRFVISEVNNIVAIMNFQPQRIPELKQHVADGRVEIVNGYFLESAINLAGGEALLRLGVQGIRWYKAMFGVRPRFSWNIDVCGTHDQMPQIARELGFEALIYTRKNPTGKSIFHSIAPDGSTILTFCPGHYSEAGKIFNTKSPLTTGELTELNAFFDTKESITPANAPLLVLGGSGDYALAPLVKSYPSSLLADWKQADLGRSIQFATFGMYFDQIKAGLDSGKLTVPSFSGGTAYDFDAFWIENPRVKTLFRQHEHRLLAAESLATVASLNGKHSYPGEDLHKAWILMCLNMDRNTHWGSAGGMVFEDRQSWDVQDRFNWVENTLEKVIGSPDSASGNSRSLFNSLNWKRNDPFMIRLPSGTALQGASCEAADDGSLLCQLELPSVGARSVKVQGRKASKGVWTAPGRVETRFYSAQIDQKTGALTSLKLKGNGKELLAGPANVIVAERPIKMPRPNDDPGDFMPVRSQRKRLGTSSDGAVTVSAHKGNVATTIEATGTFLGGGSIRRTVRFYHDYPRIDFVTELNDIPNFTVVVSEFPLAEDVTEIRRGIPFGFSHGAWSKPNPDLHGWTKGLVPAVRWSHYTLASGAGVAILDRGCSGREIEGNTPVIFLLNAEDKYYGYPNAWLSGKGNHRVEYSLVAHAEDWPSARIPQLAWEYNSPPLLLQADQVSQHDSFVTTSENVIVEAMRREDNHIEIRLVECFGKAGTASLEVRLPHTSAQLTDALGSKKQDLSRTGPRYEIPVKAQQFATVHLETSSAVPVPSPITSWDAFVPEQKLAALHAYNPETIGHPPKGS